MNYDDFKRYSSEHAKRERERRIFGWMLLTVFTFGAIVIGLIVYLQASGRMP